jgi:hypothetical protein
MLRRVSTASDLLAPYDKRQGDLEICLYLVVNRKISPKRMLNTTSTDASLILLCRKLKRKEELKRKEKSLYSIYRVIKMSLCTYAVQQIIQLSQHTSFLPHYLAQSDCLAADRQGQGDTRLTLTPSVISNSSYVIMVSD